jgi:glycosyltransferase involved in cell wall biosynthesis
MRIAINAMPSSWYGSLTYLQNLLPALDRLGDRHLWFVYGRPATLERIRFPSARVVFREVRSVGRVAGRVLMEQIGLPFLFRKDGIELAYTANNVDLFLAPRPRVIAIRYTEPFVHRHFENDFSRRLRCALLGRLSRLSLGSSDGIICVSDYARHVALAGRMQDTEKTTVIHHGVGGVFTSGRPRPGWAPPEFLFTSAKMVGYSNLRVLIEAYRSCRDRGLRLPLLVAGGSHDRRYEKNVRRQVRDLGLAEDVVFLGYIDPQAMADAMANATVFVFSSLLEACPNTLLEALACGAAVVASETEPSREVAGESVVWCHGQDPLSMADAIGRVARDAGLRRSLAAAAQQQASRYSWERTAERLVEALERIHREYASGGAGG